MQALSTGQRIMDRYELVRCIGTGLGGETWQANGPDGPVAIKVVREGDVGPGAFEDLIREAGLLRGLNHPNVVAYREFADRPDLGCAFLVTELMQGGDLGQHMNQHGPYGAQDTARLSLQLVEALQVIHDRGVLHRDLKPGNVLVCEGTDHLPLLRIADFGISRRTRDGEVDTVDVKLTPHFAAPEQFQRGSLTYAVDVYALAGIMIRIATGLNPDGDLSRQPDLIDITGESDAQRWHPLNQLIQRMVQYTPTDRPDLDQIRQALEGIEAGRAVQIAGDTPSLKTTDGFLNNEARTRVTPSSDRTAVVSPSGEKAPSRRTPLFLIGLLLITLGGWAMLTADPTTTTAPTDRRAIPPTPKAPPATPEPSSAVQSDDPEPTPAPEIPAATPAHPSPAQDATLRVSTQPWSQVSIDGRAVGRTQLGGAAFTVSPGPHRVVLEGADGTRYTKDMTLTPGENRSLCVKLRTGLESACR